MEPINALHSLLSRFLSQHLGFDRAHLTAGLAEPILGLDERTAGRACHEIRHRANDFDKNRRKIPGPLRKKEEKAQLNGNSQHSCAKDDMLLFMFHEDA